MRYRNTASFGKRQEYMAIAEMLRRDFDVYATLVDDQQIDCVVRLPEPAGPRYVDVQIKARSKNCNPRNAGTFSAMEIREPRANFFFIFYSEQAGPNGTYWIIPSLELVRLATRNKSGENAGRYRLVLTNNTVGQGVKPRPKFEEYRDRFDLLRAPLQAGTRAIAAHRARRKSKRGSTQ